MKKIVDVNIVSDGIVVVFGDRSICYYEAGMLYSRRSELAAQTFLDHDPSSQQSAEQQVQAGEKAEQAKIFKENVLCISSRL